jgi:hypothetical protein
MKKRVIVPEIDHRCHAIRCNTEIDPNKLMCAHHWSLVPPKIKKDVSRHYRIGQEKDKKPSAAWMNAAKKAIEAVAKLEGYSAK